MGRAETVATLGLASGARLVREFYCAAESVPDHRHDCVTLTIPLLGEFRALSDAGEATIAGASAVLHPHGIVHAAVVGREGLETVGLLAEIGWLRSHGLRAVLDRSRHWRGGRSGARARALARRWMRRDPHDTNIGRATAEFIEQALAAEPPPEPAWLPRVERALCARSGFDLRRMARELDLHPGWMLQAYRRAMGEGIPDALRRKRVQRAVSMLVRTDVPLADIAAATGFCDQSHMNRGFVDVIGRTPGSVRRTGGPGGRRTKS